jgi:protoporphyrinogen oxidase
MNNSNFPCDQVVVIGAGFTGLTAAYELAKQGFSVTVLESQPGYGGLAAAFDVGDTKLDCFYHHWFTNDLEVSHLINELGLEEFVEINPTNTGIYYANNFYKLSTPLDLLNFKPLNIFNRIRLGLLALKARRVKNWNLLESKTAKEWLIELGGESVYKIVWEPLLKGKFGPYAEKVSAVWFWNKLKLRGGSRGKAGEERLMYFKGGFIGLADALVDKIRELGGNIILNSPVNAVKPDGNLWEIYTPQKTFKAKAVIATPALPLIAGFIDQWASKECIDKLNKIDYIGNVCLVLELDRSLSSTYWLNVNDPNFPFVGVIEHTNFESPETYNGRHIVYLSKYLPHTDPIYTMSSDEFLSYALPYLKIMFPAIEREWIKAHHLWRARWSQPIVGKFYSKLIPPDQLADGFFVATMAQIYPEDRGTNYAIREGTSIAKKVIKSLKR